MDKQIESAFLKYKSFEKQWAEFEAEKSRLLTGYQAPDNEHKNEISLYEFRELYDMIEQQGVFTIEPNNEGYVMTLVVKKDNKKFIIGADALFSLYKAYKEIP